MGWVWKDDDDDDDDDEPSYSSSSAGDVGEFRGFSKPSGDGGGATRKVVRSQCRTEEVEPGKFIRKCEKTEQVFRDCVGRPNEMVESFKEYTEEDVRDQMVKGPFSFKLAENESSFFPGLRSDVDAIERHLFSGLDTFFRAAEDITNEFFKSVWVPHTNDNEGSSSYGKPGIHIDTDHPKETSTKKSDFDVDDDLSGLTKDV